jgi:Ser/Thr protein kinase RdoA (MazF antagonist)
MEQKAQLNPMQQTPQSGNVFEQLTPDKILAAAEHATGLQLTGLTRALPSYINRVYELRAVNGTQLIAKFYRPNRWSLNAILDEHTFVKDCSIAEVPVVAPLTLCNNSTVDTFEDIHLAVYPKRAGRQFESTGDTDWQRLGMLLGRVHTAGTQRTAEHRIKLHPQSSLQNDVIFLCEKIMPAHIAQQYEAVAKKIIDISTPLFASAECIRIHGDCHCGNILNRLDDGLMLIDFDDMAMGPPVQDLWLLLPDRAAESPHELSLIIEGYEHFRTFDRASINCIEPLRAMRMIYFLAWCSRQSDDVQFKRNFPEWNTDRFWQRELTDLQDQEIQILKSLEMAE